MSWTIQSAVFLLMVHLIMHIDFEKNINPVLWNVAFEGTKTFMIAFKVPLLCLFWLGAWWFTSICPQRSSALVLLWSTRVKYWYLVMVSDICRVQDDCIGMVKSYFTFNLESIIHKSFQSYAYFNLFLFKCHLHLNSLHHPPPPPPPPKKKKKKCSSCVIITSTSLLVSWSCWANSWVAGDFRRHDACASSL